MAELAALVLAGKVAEALEFRQAAFHTDCRILFFNFKREKLKLFGVRDQCSLNSCASRIDVFSR
jgi:hypothetical protein